MAKAIVMEIFAVRCPSRTPYQRKAGLFEPLFVDKDEVGYRQVVGPSGKLEQMEPLGPLEDFILYPSFITGVIVNDNHRLADQCVDGVILLGFVGGNKEPLFKPRKGDNPVCAFRFSGKSENDERNFDVIVTAPAAFLVSACDVMKKEFGKISDSPLGSYDAAVMSEAGEETILLRLEACKSLFAKDECAWQSFKQAELERLKRKGLIDNA